MIDTTKFATYIPSILAVDGYLYGALASGNLDLVVEKGLGLHDFAALVPIVTGAGGVMTDWSGADLRADSPGDVIACSDDRLHAQALQLLGS